MTTRDRSAIHRYCRAEKRSLDRATKLVETLRTHAERVAALDADKVLHARRRVAAHWWERMPEGARKAIRNPMEATRHAD